MLSFAKPSRMRSMGSDSLGRKTVSAATRAARFRPRCPATRIGWGPTMTSRLLASCSRRPAIRTAEVCPKLRLIAPPGSEVCERILGELWGSSGRIHFEVSKGHLWATDLGPPPLDLELRRRLPGSRRVLPRAPARAVPVLPRRRNRGAPCPRARSLASPTGCASTTRSTGSGSASTPPCFLAYGRSAIVRRPWIKGFWANPLSKASLDRVVVSKRERSAVAVPDEPQAVESH